MDAKAFLDTHGKDVAEQVAIKAGTNYAYFSQIAHGHRFPSRKMARALVDASAELVKNEGAQLDMSALIEPNAA